MILCLALSPSVDVTYTVPGLTIGAINRPASVVRVPGGKGLNVARVVHALGAQVQVVAPLGGASGRWIADRLAADGPPTSVIEVEAETRTCVAIVDPDADAAVSTDLYESAARLTEHDFARVAAAALAVPGPGWLAISGSVAADLDDVAALIDRMRLLGWRLALDGYGEALARLAPLADLVKVNVSEALELVGGEPHASPLAEALLTRGPQVAIVTDGVRGAALSSADGERCLAPVPRTLGAYPTGSGDAFLGGLLSGIDAGRPLADALAVAADTAERNARVPGPGILG